MTRRRWTVLAMIVAALSFPAGWLAYAGTAWLRYGHATTAGADTNATRFMPTRDLVEVHRIRVHARPAATYHAMMEVDLQHSTLIRTIFRSRELMLGAGRGERRNLPFIPELLQIGWGILDSAPGRALTVGAVTQPWKANVVFHSMPAAEFATFAEPDHVKILVIFAVDSLAPAESEFRTETWVLTTDAGARAKFRRYWSVFSPGILLIRHEALKLVKRHAENPQPLIRNAT
jgi:hypothetical protein